MKRFAITMLAVGMIVSGCIHEYRAHDAPIQTADTIIHTDQYFIACHDNGVAELFLYDKRSVFKLRYGQVFADSNTVAKVRFFVNQCKQTDFRKIERYKGVFGTYNEVRFIHFNKFPIFFRPDDLQPYFIIGSDYNHIVRIDTMDIDDFMNDLQQCFE